MNNPPRTSRLVTSILLLLCASRPLPAADDKTEFIRAQAPPLLSYAELVELGTKDEIAAPLQERLDKLLTTPFISNEAYLSGIRPLAPQAPQLGKFTRVALWNIERGLKLDKIKLIFKDPDEFYRQIAGHPDYLAVLQEAHVLRNSNILIVNEADLGVKRTEYRDVIKELAEAAGMNYVYGVEFLEVDPLALGIETFEGAAAEDREAMRKEVQVDESRYRGLHGTAVLSKYPIRSATVRPFLYQGHDWYRDEKKGVARIEEGKREIGEKVFLEKVLREIRRGGRMMLIADLAVPEIPEGTLTVVATHLENRCKPEGRQTQMHEVLTLIQDRRNPVILAGDMNTTGSDNTPTTVKREITKRLGSGEFWSKQGLKYATGVGLVLDVTVGGVGLVRKHSDPTVRDLFLIAPNPEVGLFEMLEKMRFADHYAFDFRGDPERTINKLSGTLANSNQRDNKGFAVTYEVERALGLAGQFKLDWIFVKPYVRDPRDSSAAYRFAPHFARTLSTLNHSVPDRLSDHDPLTVDLPLEEPDIKPESQPGLWRRFKRIF